MVNDYNLNIMLAIWPFLHKIAAPDFHFEALQMNDNNTRNSNNTTVGPF